MRGTPCMLAAALALAGCGAEELGPALRLELPLAAFHRSVIVGVEADGEPLSLVAADVVDGQIEPVNQPLAPAQAVDVTALLYDAPLSAVGLKTGPLVLEANPDMGRQVPTPAEIHAAQVDASYAPAWAEVSELPEALAQARLPPLDPCARFVARAVSLGTTAPPTSVVALDAQWAVVTTEGPEVFFVAGNQVLSQAVPTPLYSGYVRDDGQIWFGGEGGAIFSATFTPLPQPRLELTAEGFVDSREAVLDLVGAPDGAVEHFAMTSNLDPDEQWGAFEWFDGTEWRTPGLRRNTPHDATWVRRGFGLFASFFREGQIYGALDGDETSINVTSVVLGNAVVIEQVPGLGMVAATTAGEVHLGDAAGEGWRLLATATTQRIGDVHGYEDGLVYLYGTTIGHYPRDGRDCDPSALFTPDFESINRFDVVGENVIVPLMRRDGEASAEQQVAWFQRER